MEAKKTDSQTSNTQKKSLENPETMTMNQSVIVQGACSGVADIWRARTEDLGDVNER